MSENETVKVGILPAEDGKPSASADFWSKFARPTDPTTDPNGVTTNAPALKPVTEDAPALEPVTAGGAPLPSIKELPAASAAHSAPRVCQPTPSLAPRFHCT